MKPLITFHINSFNRLPMLRNMMASFDLCNVYENVEWVFVDLGSTDGSRDFISDYAKNSPFECQLIFGNQAEYFDSIRELGLPIDTRWKQLRAILMYYRNTAKTAAKGDYIFDLADDQQFIRKGPWIEEIFEVFEHREKTTGRDDLLSYVPFAYYRWRLDKANNQRGTVQNSLGTPYFVAVRKAYVDYSVMKKSTWSKLGPFIKPGDIAADPALRKMWIREDGQVAPWTVYERNAELQSYKRAFLKYPILTLFPNGIEDRVEFSKEGTLCRIWTLREMVDAFENLDRPIAAEDLDDGTLFT